MEPAQNVPLERNTNTLMITTHEMPPLSNVVKLRKWCCQPELVEGGLYIHQLRQAQLDSFNF